MNSWSDRAESHELDRAEEPAFSAERLAKEFYGRLSKWYERACGDERVECPDTDAGDREDGKRKHLLRLITYLLFVWFLKQKGLVPRELFDEKSLARILKDFRPADRTRSQYCRAILQNLFFATLNTAVGDRGFADDPRARTAGGKARYRHADEFAISRREVLELFRPIPFLNGGLFEPRAPAHVPDDLFFDPAYGLLPLLRRYDFTVEENLPGDVDAALGPELLGKVFENLLGAFNPGTKETLRKSTGSFYTPRGIVDYMVDESLVAYLVGKAAADEKSVRALIADGVRPDDAAACRRLAEAIETVKIIDPACGSGAFPVGALLKMAEILRILEKRPEGSSLYDIKLKLVENCIFGSDIQEIAVQISKLRMFISLVCELEPDRTKPNCGIHALPDLETNYVAANSLIGPEREGRRDRPRGAGFFDPERMFGVKDGFDIVIGNPPYGIVNKKQNKGVSIVVGESDLAHYRTSPFYAEARGRGFLNVYRLFVKRSQALLAKSGILAEIIPLAYAGDLSSAALRKHMFSTSQTLCIDAFPERDDPSRRVFEAAKISVCILIARNAEPKNPFRLRIHRTRFVDAENTGFLISTQMMAALDPVYMRLPIVEEGAFGILVKMGAKAKPLGLAARSREGELNMTLDKGAFSKKTTFPRMLRGAGIARYALPEKMSQGDDLFVDEGKLKDPGAMRRLKEAERIALQGISGVNERWRIKAVLVRGMYCANSANYILVGGRQGRILLGILNSRLLNFYFSKFSANSNVNGYELDALPVFPPMTPGQQARMLTHVDNVLKAKKHDPGSDTSAEERAIDRLVYDLYGLTDEERGIVEGSYGRAGEAPSAEDRGIG